MINIKKIEVQFGSNDANILYEGKPLDSYDCAYVKGSFNYAAVAKAITAYLSPKTYVPVAEDAFTTVHDKLLTHISLQKKHIPSPKTYLSATPIAAKSILQSIQYPVILKFPQGTQGKGVMFAESYAAASSLLDALVSLKQPFLIQEYVETSGVDIRAIVAGDKIIASYKRIAKSDEKRSNMHAGGTGEPVLLDAKTKKIAIQTAKALNCDICGVDILEGPRGPFVIEANVSPGLQGITKVTNIDVAGKIAEFLYQKTLEFKESKKQNAVSANEILAELTSEGVQSTNQIITNVDFRANRILLPEFVTSLSQIKDGDEATFEVSKGKISIKK